MFFFMWICFRLIHAFHLDQAYSYSIDVFLISIVVIIVAAILAVAVAILAVLSHHRLLAFHQRCDELRWLWGDGRHRRCCVPATLFATTWSLAPLRRYAATFTVSRRKLVAGLVGSSMATYIAKNRSFNAVAYFTAAAAAMAASAASVIARTEIACGMAAPRFTGHQTA